MTKPPRSRANHTNQATVLSISPIENDHDELKRILNRSALAGDNSQWCFRAVPTVSSALPLLRSNRVGVVVAEQDLGSDTWKEVLAACTQALGPQTVEVREQILGGTATGFYRL